MPICDKCDKCEKCGAIIEDDDLSQRTSSYPTGRVPKARGPVSKKDIEMEKLKLKIISEYENKPIDENLKFNKNGLYRSLDGYINITRLCECKGKNINHWKPYSNDLDIISSTVGIPVSDLIKTEKEPRRENPCPTVWAHRLVAELVAYWISPEYLDEFNEWLDRLEEYVVELEIKSCYRSSDNFANLTKLCKVGNKQSTRLARSSDCTSEIEQNTWVHPTVAIHIALWISEKFAKQVSNAT